RKLFEGTPEKSAAVSDASVACATVLWDRPDRSWLPKAAELAPEGAPGAAVRAAAALIRLLPETGKRPDESARKAALAEYQAQLKLMVPSPHATAGDQAILSLLGWMGASASPTTWTASGAEEKALMEE